MNLRDLEYVLALGETGHFGAAASRCGVTQPTLSTQIAWPPKPRWACSSVLARHRAMQAGDPTRQAPSLPRPVAWCFDEVRHLRHANWRKRLRIF